MTKLINRFDGQSRLDDHEWALIADAYCPRFKIAVLARIAVKARNAKSSFEGIGRAAAEQDAKTAMNAYRDAVGKSNLIGDLCDVEIEALRGELWIEKINATVGGFFGHYEIEFSAPPVHATTNWIVELGKAAKAFVDVYDKPTSLQASGGFGLGDIDRLLQEGTENIEATLWHGSDDVPQRRPAIRLKELAEYMRRIALGVALAQEMVNDYDFFAKSSSWRWWINSLTDVCKEYGLPIECSNRSPESSEFVGLVKALMERMPMGLIGRRKLEAGALSQSIYRARKYPNQKKNKRDRASEHETPPATRGEFAKIRSLINRDRHKSRI